MSVVEAPRSQGLIARVINILMRPKAEWEVIAGEHATTQGLILGYAATLAAIPAIARVISGLLPHCFFAVCYTPNPIWVVVSAVVYYLLSLASVFVIGLIIDALAPSFAGEKNQVQAMKVAVYSWTAAWLVGIFVIIPWVGWLLTLAGLYSLYLLYTGLTPLMRSPPDRAPIYTLVVVVLAIIVFLIAGAITAPLAMIGALNGGGTLSNGAPGALSGTVHLGNGASIDLGKLQAAIPQAEQQLRDSQRAAANGKINAIDPNVLKGLLPDNVAGAPRTEISAVTAGAAGMGGSDAEATYQNGDTHITLKVADIAAAGGIAAMAGAVNVQEDRETTTGYEKVQTINGRLTTEKYDNQDKSGEYSIIVASRFVISAEGSGVSMDALKAAVASVGPDRLEALAHG
jgi:MFS family permease